MAERATRILRGGLVLLSALLLAVTAAFWIRGYWTTNSVSYWGERRYELWSQAGQFGLYVSVNHRTDMPRITWTQMPLQGFWSNPGFPPMRFIEPDRSLFKGFEFADSRGGFEVEIPDWALVLLFSIAPAAWLLAVWRRFRRRRHGCCIACGYDLRATPGRCPECGAEPAIARSDTPLHDHASRRAAAPR